MFHTELREVFAIMNFRRNKRLLYEVLLRGPSYRILDEETINVMSVILDAPRLWSERKRYINRNENKEVFVLTLSQLKEKVKKYRRKMKDFECNLFWEKLRPGILSCVGRKLGPYDTGFYVVETNGTWEVYQCEYERGGSELVCIFYSASDAYDFIFCYYKDNAEFPNHLIWH